MSLKEIFHKPVDRNIEGVIKADDDASLRLELDEYVITNEVEKRLESFLDAYNNYAGANGVWISGFFGSGKSHLLKMLALLLGNREVEGATALELFLEKTKDNEILRGDLKKAVSIPTESILFNIDQKADVISKKEVDALLAVFIKVFDEHCGYYGKLPFVAQFERDLDRDGLLQKFISEVESISDKEWPWIRMREKRMAKPIDEAYGKVVGQSVSNIIDKYRSDYRLSIEDFAEQVDAYIQCREENFRLNFFVDEVGQYIAGNVKLMTNLQTIAESLATKCRGRSWVIVTAQEDMSSVIGDAGKQQSNDFSKIQARFKNRMKLTSQDVAEVIQKRLLLKNDLGVEELTGLYHAQSNNFKTLFDFADGSPSYRNFQDRDHFIHSYPFIPYQFSLFQSAIQNLSAHNAFEGKASSVGERSMLGVFQQVAMQIADHAIGQLATFDLMFEGIRTALKSQIQRAVLQAENQLDNTFAIQLLKALFLVKYVKEFKATVRNLCVLMLDRFDQDLPQLRKQVEEALNLLEQQTYIQRTGNQYEYLTDEEKDVEEEIKTTEVETADVAEELQKIVFDHIIKNRKIRYDANGQNYTYSRKLDDKLYGREHELAIHVITPFHEHVESDSVLYMQSMGRDELVVVMSPEERLIRDLLMFKKTEKYIRQNVSITQQDTIKRILSDKGLRNQERHADIQQCVKKLLGKAKLIVAGADVDLSGEDPQSRITRGFHHLIERAYPNLRMLRNIQYTEKDVAKYLRQAGEGLLGNDATAMLEQEQEVLAFIQSNNRGGVRTTLKSLLENFERKPYGWYYAAILCTVAMLYARGKLEIRSDGNLLEDDALEKALLNSAMHGNVILEPQVEFSASQVRNLREFYEEFFDEPPQSSEAKALGKETGEAFNQLIGKLQPIVDQADEYPFLNVLIPEMETINAIAGKPYTWILVELARQEDDLLDLKEDLIAPIMKFMAGSRKKIYKATRTFLQDQQANFAYVESDEPEKMRAILDDPKCYRGNAIQQLKTLHDSSQLHVEEQVKQKRDEAIEKISSLADRLKMMDDFKKLTSDQQLEIDSEFESVFASLKQQELIAVIKDSQQRFENQKYTQLLQKISQWLKPDDGDGDDGGAGDDTVAEYIPIKSVYVTFEKSWLANDSDVDQYLQQMREALLEVIREGKRIQM